MGLDQFIFLQDCDEPTQEKFISHEWNKIERSCSAETFRNYWALHTAIGDLWEEQGKPLLFSDEMDESFNCIHFKLTAEQFESIVRSLDSKFDEKLPEIDYDENEDDEEEDEEDDLSHLSDAEYYRQQCHNVLEQLKHSRHPALYCAWF